MTSCWSLDDWKRERARQERLTRLKRYPSAEILPLYLKPTEDWAQKQPAGALQLSQVDRVILKLANERDDIQKKAFTKWVNKHLKLVNKQINDLFIDFRDGRRLIILLELISGEKLSQNPANGRFRLFCLHRVQICLDFLRCRKVKLVNIRAEDIVEGNSKLTLGLIWTLILRFQASDVEEYSSSTKDSLLQWAKRVTEGYQGVNVRDLTTSFRDGLAFNAILHRYRPDLINWRDARTNQDARQRLHNAFDVAEREYGVPKLLDPRDVDVPEPDEKSMTAYIASLRDALGDRWGSERHERRLDDYRSAARELLRWIQRSTRTMQDRALPRNVAELKQLLADLDRFKADELPPRQREKERLEDQYADLERQFADTAYIRSIEEELTPPGLDRAWKRLLAAISDRDRLLSERERDLLSGRRSADYLERDGFAGGTDDLTRRMDHEIGLLNEKLDRILERIEDGENRSRTASPRQLKEHFDGIIDDLIVLEVPIESLFQDVETLKANRHPLANDYYRQVFGLHQRRIAYLERCGVIVGADGKITGQRDLWMSEDFMRNRSNLFKNVEECIEWVERMLKELQGMQFVDDVRAMEEALEKHKLVHRDVMDFRHRVDQCISNQSKVSAEDSPHYVALLRTLEDGYAQLRELSAGRMLDLDSLVAFIRAAQLELLWIQEREELEVTRNWSDLGRLDLPMLQNYYKQLMHEIELREEQFTAVHNQGAALVNQGHPAIHVIEAYLSTMQSQWDWLLGLTQCLEVHLQDAVNYQQFVEDSRNCDQWMEKQLHILTTQYERSNFTLDEGERYLKELEEIRQVLERYHGILASLVDRSRVISPIWQRGERVDRPTPVVALCNFQDKNATVRKHDECVLHDNTDLVRWAVRTAAGEEAVVPSVVFRFPPPDEQLLAMLQRLRSQFDRLRRLWTEKERMVRFNMLLNTMRTIQGWDLKTFNSLDPDNREAILKALNEDTNKLLAELDPNDPMAQRLLDELRRTNDHYYNLLKGAQRGPEGPDQFSERANALLAKLEEAWQRLSERVAAPLPRDTAGWEKLILEHKLFEDSLQGLDTEVSMVRELFRQLSDPTPFQRSRMDQLLGRWEDLWEESRMYAERLKVLEEVLSGLTESTQIVSEHEKTMVSFESLPAKVNELRAVHSQLLELQLILQQQQPIFDDLGKNVGHLRQHVARTRINVAEHPDVDRLEEEAQRVIERWENICAQVIDRLKTSEVALRSLMLYRASYENEMTWLERVEKTISTLRRPEDLRPEEYQEQLDILVAEYANLTERTSAMEKVNLEGGKFIRDAKVYDIRLHQYRDILEELHKGIDSLVIRRTTHPLPPGAELVAKELEELNKRFAQLSSVIFQRRNDLQLLMQKWRQAQRQKEIIQVVKRPPPRPVTPPPPRPITPPPRRISPPPRPRTPTPPPRPRSPVLHIQTGRVITEDTRPEGLDTWRRRPPTPEAIVPKVQPDDSDQIMYAEETIERTKFFDLDAIKHMQTGEILTFVEAVRQGLLDLAAGEFFDDTGTKISLEEAVKRGHVSQSLNDALQTQYGIRDPATGEELNLYDAIQRGLYDPECRQLRDPNTGELLSLYEASRLGVISMDNVHRLIKLGILKLPPLFLEQAIEQKVIDIENGQFVGRFSKETLHLRDALRNGYITLTSPTTPMIAMSLSECIEQRFINPQSGEFQDRNTNEKFTLRDAIAKTHNLISLSNREVVNTNERKRITVGDAVLRNIINARQGNFTDTGQRQTFNLQEAYDREYIQRPLTLKEIAYRDAIDSTGRFIDKGTKKRLTLIEAIAEGLLDPDTPHIRDPDEKDVISLGAALERGLLTPQGQFVDVDSGKEYSIQDAYKRGVLAEPVKYTVFDLRSTVKNTKTNRMLTFNEAVSAGIIRLDSERFVDLAANESYLLPDTVERARLVDPALHTILSAMSGIKDRHGSEMNVFRAICTGVIEPKKGAFVDRGGLIPPKEAYERGLVTLKGAMQLSALFNVSPSLVAISKPAEPKRKRARPQEGGFLGQVKTTLSEALRQGLVDTKSQRYRHGDKDITLQEALDRGLVDTSTEWVVPPKDARASKIHESVTEEMTETSQLMPPKYEPSGQSEETLTTVKRLRTKETTTTGGPGGVAAVRAITSGRGALEVPVDGLHIFVAERDGLFDFNTGQVTVPDTEQKLSLEEALDLGIINSRDVVVPDPKTGQQVNLREALERGVVDSRGHLRDHRTGSTMHLRQAIDAGHVTVQPEPHKEYKPVTKTIQFGVTAGPVMSITPIGEATMEESESSFSFDPKAGEVVDGHSGRRYSLDDALRTGIVSKEMLLVKDALTDREMPYAEAVSWGLIDSRIDWYNDKKHNAQYSLREAAARGLICVSGGSTQYAKDAVRTDVRQQLKKVVSTKEAAIAGPSTFVDYGLQRIIDLGWYNQESGQFTHPDTKKQLTLKEAIIKGLFNPYETSVTDSRTGEHVSLLDAVQKNIVDATNGTVLDSATGQRVNLKTAFERGLIRSGTTSQSLDAAITSGRLDLSTGEYRWADGKGSSSLHEAISRGIISPESIVVRDPSSGQQLSFSEAVRERVVDLNSGLVINKASGEGVGLAHAIISGVVQPVSHTGAVIRRPLDVAPYKAPEPSREDRQRVVDIGGDKRVMVKVIKDEQGVEKGEYIDPNTGMKFTVRLHDEPYVTQMQTTVKSTAQVQSVELEPHAELIGIDKVRDNRTGRVMTLSEAQRIGLAKVDKHGKQLTKTYAVFRSDIGHAVSRGVLDPNNNQRISLADAIKSRLIDIRDLLYIHPQTNEKIDFVQAANMGLLDLTLAEILPKGVCNPANGERISINRAIDLRIIDPRSGAVTNPFKKEEITWLDILKPVYSSVTMEGVYDPRKGYAVPIISAINDNLLNVRSKRYNNPITNEQYTLEEAVKVGLIDEGTFRATTERSIQDWHSGQRINLLEAVEIGLVDPQRRMVQVSRGVFVPIGKAVEEGKFPRDIGQRMRRVDKMTFAEALGRGLIDIRSNQFHDPESGRRITVSQAIQEGYIDMGSVTAREGADERNLSQVIDSYEFDENSGRMREHKTGLYLTFREAIDRGLIDGDSLICDVDRGRTMTLRSALAIRLINPDGKCVDKKTGAKINLKEAVRLGLLALIPSPMLAGQAFAEAIKRREKEGYKFKLQRAQSPSLPSLSPVGDRHIVEEEVTTIRMTPKVEPSLSIRVRTDDVSDRLRSFISDPQAYADRQRDFMQRLQESGYDVDEKTLENPSTGSRISVREAVDSGLLDVLSGEIVNPRTGVRYSIPKAVHMKLLQPSAGKRVMEALNLNLSELYAAVQDLSPRSDFTPLSAISPDGSLASLVTPREITTVKEVTWRGDLDELRATKGELTSHYTTTYGSRTSLPEDRVLDGDASLRPGSYERIVTSRSDGFGDHTGDSGFRPGSYEYVTERHGGTGDSFRPGSYEVVSKREVREGRLGEGTGDSGFRPGSYEYTTERHGGLGDSSYRPGSYEQIVTKREVRDGRPGEYTVDSGFRPGSHEYRVERPGSYEYSVERHGSSADPSFRPGSYEHREVRHLGDSGSRPGSYEYVREERYTDSSGRPAGKPSSEFDVQFRRVGGPQRVISDEELARSSPDEEGLRRSTPIRIPERDRKSFDDLLRDVVQLE